MHMPRILLFLLLMMLLAGCVIPALPLAAGLGAAGAASQVPGWIQDAQDVIQGVKTLTEAEQLACTLQSVANAQNDSTFSTIVGKLCKWS
jgi:hypothetical protein